MWVPWVWRADTAALEDQETCLCRCSYHAFQRPRLRSHTDVGSWAKLPDNTPAMHQPRVGLQNKWSLCQCHSMQPGYWLRPSHLEMDLYCLVDFSPQTVAIGRPPVGGSFAVELKQENNADFWNISSKEKKEKIMCITPSSQQRWWLRYSENSLCVCTAHFTCLFYSAFIVILSSSDCGKSEQFILIA